ncbi:WD40 repeat-like protein [Hesseltinella vesiculosa]|uniref:WD40 repeat-like protein n=1 Tax=Hesseltinella vesiculosa TaxID=101127 RepID=A0A1X2GPE5_9FUNG|nr:WD40 repeat-like protein [Hesseltinella vesiculosa]
MISALQWIRQGVAAQHPQKYELNEEEYDRISKLATDQLEDAREELKAAEAMAVDEKKAPVANKDDELAVYNLDAYDDEVEADKKTKKVGIFAKIKDLAYYDNDEEDPYVTMNADGGDEDEKTDLEIMPTDNLLLSAKTEDDISHLEVYVFESAQENLYVHHDIMLPSFPLCLEWLDFHCGQKVGEATSGNYVAVGTFEPDIEIWNLDLVDAMYPEAILGHTDKTKKRSKKVNANYHVDAIMDISWNKHHRNFMLSSSADGTIKLWDLTTAKCMQSYSHHSDKVQSVAWHPTEPTVFMSGSYDKSVCVLDARSPEQVTRWTLDSDVESLHWDPHHPTCFYVALENGFVHYYDIQNKQGSVGGKPLYMIQAHEGAVSSFDINPLVPGCIATGGVDKAIKIWSTIDNRPSMVTSRNFDLGKVFCAQFCPDSAFQLAVAGSNGKMHIWDISSNAGVRSTFQHIQALQGNQGEEKAPITIADNEDPESDAADETMDAQENSDSDEDMEED